MTLADHLPRVRPFDVHDYHRMGETGILGPDERVELIEGKIVFKAKKTPLRCATVTHLNHLLQVHEDERVVVSAFGPIRLSNLSEPEPDLALLHHRDDFHGSAHPTAADTLLVIEASDTGIESLRETRLPLYARHGVPQVWLVDARGKRVVDFSEPSAGSYSREREWLSPDTPSPDLLDGLTVDLSVLFRAFR